MSPAVPAMDDDKTDEFLRWLESEPADDVLDDLEALRGRLRMFSAQGGAGGALRRVLEGAALRVLDISTRVRARLQEASLPLPRALHVASTHVCKALIDIAQRLADRGAAPGREGGAQLRGADVRSALGLCYEAFVVAAMSAAPAPAGLWRLAHGVALGVEEDASYNSMLAIAAAQPESFTARQLAWLVDFLAAEIERVSLSVQGESQASMWWVELEGDAQPVSSARRPVQAGADVRQFSLAPLARVLLEHIRQLEDLVAGSDAAGEPVEVEMLDTQDEGLPPGLTPVEILALLRTLRERWASTPLRELPRRSNHYVVQVCVGLRALWELGRGRRESGRVLEWQVLNESPGGYAIMSVAGVDSGVITGIVLGLRRQPGEAWTVCVVRWVRSDNPDQVELGLQVLAPSYQSVQVGFRGAALPSVVPALALPVMEPLRRHPAFIAPAGTYASRRFVFVRDGEHLYVAQARALGLDMQTASIELFQYEIDPYPI